MVEPTYIDLATLKADMKITDTLADTQLTRALTTASRSIDRFTDRRFYLDASTSPRVYRPGRRVVWDRDGMLLMVDDIGDATGLVVETGTAGNWTPITDFETAPDNALARGRPVTALLRLAWWFGGYGLRLRVTARWGWPTVPDEVVEAALIQSRRLYRRKDSPEGVTGSGDWGPIRVTKLDPDVQNLIGHLKLPAIA